jgi:hypothetical protein
MTVKRRIEQMQTRLKLDEAWYEYNHVRRENCCKERQKEPPPDRPRPKGAMLKGLDRMPTKI